MKKYEEMNNLILKSNKKRKLTKVVVIAILVLTLAMATGCGKKKNKTPTPITPSATVTKEETTPEVVEPTESAPVETVPEEKTTIDLTKYDSPIDCINDLKQSNELMIIVWNDDGGQTILKNGDHYNNSMSSSFYFNREFEEGSVKDVVFECEEDNAEVHQIMKYYYSIITAAGNEVEYKVTFIYNDGKEESITVYITEE